MVSLPVLHCGFCKVICKSEGKRILRDHFAIISVHLSVVMSIISNTARNGLFFFFTIAVPEGVHNCDLGCAKKIGFVLLIA